MSKLILISLRKRKLQLVQKEAIEIYKSDGIDKARFHVEDRIKEITNITYPYENKDNINSKSFIISETIVVKSYNSISNICYMFAQINLNEEIEMDSEPSSLGEKNKLN